MLLVILFFIECVGELYVQIVVTLVIAPFVIMIIASNAADIKYSFMILVVLFHMYNVLLSIVILFRIMRVHIFTLPSLSFAIYEYVHLVVVRKCCHIRHCA